MSTPKDDDDITQVIPILTMQELVDSGPATSERPTKRLRRITKPQWARPITEVDD